MPSPLSKLETVPEQEDCPVPPEPHPRQMLRDSAHIESVKDTEQQLQAEREPSRNGRLFDPAMLQDFLPKPQAFRVLKSYMDINGFGRWVKDAYNDLVAKHIPNCINESNTFVAMHEGTCTKHTFVLSNPHVGQPEKRDSSGKRTACTSLDCRATSVTYTVPIFVDVKYTRTPLTLEELEHVREINTQATRRKNNRLATSRQQQPQHADGGQGQHVTLPDPQIAQLRENMEIVLRNLHLDDIPCMVDSRFCSRRSTVLPEMVVADRMDAGGYFVIEGVEKVIGGQEQMANNTPVVLEKDDKILVCEVRSQPEHRLRSSSTFYVTLKPSLPLSHMTTTEARRAVDCDITVRLPFSQDIAVTTMFIALDVCKLQDMLNLICTETDPLWLWNFVSDTLNFSLTNTTITKMAAFGKIRPEKAHGDADALIKVVNNMLNTEFLPHQGITQKDLSAKRVLLGLYVRRTILVYLMLQPVDNREHYRNRRNISVFYLSMIWRDAFVQWRKIVQQTMNFELSRNVHALDPRNMLIGTMGRRMTKALKSGNLTINQDYSDSAKGVSSAGQIRANTEYMAGVAHLLRTNSQGETADARMPHDTGAVCRFDTPDGGNVGMTRNMTICAGVRAGHSAQQLAFLVTSFLGPKLMPDVTAGLSEDGSAPVPVLVNGRLIGYVYNPYQVREDLRELRSVSDLPPDVSLYVDRYADMDVGTLNINGDAGAFYWPLIRVDKMEECKRIVATTNTVDLWPRLLQEGVGELICKDEEYWHVRVAMYHHEIGQLQGVTHVLIDECQCFSIYTNRMPHIQYNQAPRISFGATMLKQCCSIAPSTPCLDTCANFLETPQRSLVTTAFDKIVGPDTGACYQQAIVCVGGYYGNNIEDSLTIKKEALERGFARVQQYRTFRDFCNSKENEVEQYCLPPEHTLGRIVGDDGKVHNDKINPETGVVDPGVFVTPDDIIVSKVVAIGVRDKYETVAPGTKRTVIQTYRDRSIKSKHYGQVCEVLRYKTSSGHDAVSITLRATKVPQTGDKFSSRHAQKTSLACIAPAVDMPWCPRTGIVPDIIINPHAMPSRMTIGHLLETLHSKLAAIAGIEINGTPGSQGLLYNDPEIMSSATNRSAVIRAVGRALKSFGLREDGCEEMRCGKSGKRLETAMFVGPLSYMRLKHMVEDKQHARARGPMDSKTRQPEEGRAKNGGLRFGEMEKDVLINHGAADLLRERLFLSSDPAEFDVCTKCGFFTNSGAKINDRSLCRWCVQYTGRTVRLPFALVLQVLEMQGMHYGLRLGIDEAGEVK